MKRHIMSIVTVAALVLGAGCGKKNDTPPVEKSPPAETKKPEATKPPETAKTETAKPAEDKEAPKVTAPPANDPLAAPADVAAPPADAERTATGLASKVLTPGTGKEHPAKRDTVKVHYTGWTKDGKRFDSSVARGEPTEFPLNAVIPGWTEGLQLMVVGEKRRFWIPANLAYGKTPRRPGAPSGQLTFDVELLGITKAPTMPAPPDVAAPPADATKTASGLAYKVVKKGEGDGKHPAATDRVTVHYSGWTTDGELFDSSVLRGSPATFPLNGVIPGWTEGLQLLNEGGKAELYIPGNLAYGPRGRGEIPPSATLLFEVELLEVR